MTVLSDPTVDLRTPAVRTTGSLSARNISAWFGTNKVLDRLSTLDICDRIMVIQDGTLLGFDTPSRLKQSSKFYSEALTMSGLA